MSSRLFLPCSVSCRRRRAPYCEAWTSMDFNDVRLQYEAVRDEIDGAVREGLAGGRYVLGRAMLVCEDEFARYCRVAEGITVGSGIAARPVALRAFGVGPGGE